MPWCTSCDRFLTPPSVTAGGACPTCGRPVDVGRIASRAAEGRAAAGGDLDDLAPIPWHFKLLAVAVVAYLAFRFYQAFDWLSGLF